MARFEFFVEGKVAGQHRPRFTRDGRVYSVRDDRAAQQRVRSAFLAEYGRVRRTMRPCSVLVETWRALPKSRPKKTVEEPDVYKPDADNVTKLVLDALTGLVWMDDRQVFELHTVKHPRTRREADLMRVSVEVM